MALKRPLVLGPNNLPQVLQPTDTIVANTSYTQTESLTNAAASAVPFGTPMYRTSVASAVNIARANAGGTARVCGLVYDATIAASATGTVATSGLVIAGTTSQWDTITGQTGGLTPGSLYYLDSATAGKLTATPTTGANGSGVNSVIVGEAVDTLTMSLEIEFPVAL